MVVVKRVCVKRIGIVGVKVVGDEVREREEVRLMGVRVGVVIVKGGCDERRMVMDRMMKGKGRD